MASSRPILLKVSARSVSCPLHVWWQGVWVMTPRHADREGAVLGGCFWRILCRVGGREVRYQVPQCGALSGMWLHTVSHLTGTTTTVGSHHAAAYLAVLCKAPGAPPRLATVQVSQLHRYGWHTNRDAAQALLTLCPLVVRCAQPSVCTARRFTLWYGVDAVCVTMWAALTSRRSCAAAGDEERVQQPAHHPRAL